jgi:hypothetical protein
MPDHYCPDCGHVEYDCHCRSAKGVAPQTAYPPTVEHPPRACSH